MNPKTINEFCGKPSGAFKEFITRKEEFLRQIERERKTRIRAHSTQESMRLIGEAPFFIA